MIKLFRPEDFQFIDETLALCPAGKILRGSGVEYQTGRKRRMQYKADAKDCNRCRMREHCLMDPRKMKPRTVSRAGPCTRSRDDAAEHMRRAIYSEEGR